MKNTKNQTGLDLAKEIKIET